MYVGLRLMYDASTMQEVLYAGVGRLVHKSTDEDHQYVLAPPNGRLEHESPIFAGVRHHIVVTRDYHGMSVFIDGEQLRSGELEPSTTVAIRNEMIASIAGGVFLPPRGKSNFSCTLGGMLERFVDPGELESGFRGEISMFRYYTGRLSAAEVAAMYAADMPILEHAWDFATVLSNGPTDQDIVIDSIGNISSFLDSSSGHSLGAVVASARSLRCSRCRPRPSRTAERRVAAGLQQLLTRSLRMLVSWFAGYTNIGTTCSSVWPPVRQPWPPAASTEMAR